MTMLVEELCVLLRVGLRFFIEPLEHSLREHLIELLHQSRVLHGFARNVQREVLAIDHPTQEAKPFGEETFRLRLDEYAAAVEMHLHLAARESDKLVVLFRDE